ncbi:MAG: HAD family hydrolase [Ruminococcaceae bacterium]|nr:HAD family hydrolase [Oscillospiraceae bacterium]
MYHKSYTHIFWDFNGTILDDADACFKSENDLFEKYGLPLLPSKEVYKSLFGFPVKDYYRRMGFDFEKTPYEILAAEWMERYLIHVENAALCPHVADALEYAKGKGIFQWVLSASKLEMLEEQLTALGVRSYFEGILGQDNIHAGSKEYLGRAWRAANPSARVLFIGDTDHDAATALAMGADCVLLTTGHSTKERLLSCHTLFVAENAYKALTQIFD